MIRTWDIKQFPIHPDLYGQRVLGPQALWLMKIRDSVRIALRQLLTCFGVHEKEEKPNRNPEEVLVAIRTVSVYQLLLEGVPNAYRGTDTLAGSRWSQKLRSRDSSNGTSVNICMVEDIRCPNVWKRTYNRYHYGHYSSGSSHPATRNLQLGKSLNAGFFFYFRF